MFRASVAQIRIIVVLLSFPILLFRYFRLEINFILITSDFLFSPSIVKGRGPICSYVQRAILIFLNCPARLYFTALTTAICHLGHPDSCLFLHVLLPTAPLPHPRSHSHADPYPTQH